MILEEGDIINLNFNNKDYIVVKNISHNGVSYSYLMTTEKPVEVCIVKLANDESGNQVLENVTDPTELEKIIALIN